MIYLDHPPLKIPTFKGGIMTKRIDIKQGFHLIERKTRLSFAKAYSALTSRRMRYVTRAEERKYSVEITRHAYRCPYCGKEIPAYDSEAKLPSREDVEEWCSPQLDMFSSEPKPTLEIQEPFTERKNFFCPRCGIKSKPAEKSFTLTLESTYEYVKLSRPVAGVDELLEIPWLKVVDLSGNEEIYEAVIFDLSSGYTSLTLENKDGFALVSRYVQGRISNDELGFFGNLLTHHRVVKRCLKAAFQSFSKIPIPFTLKELDFTHFRLLCSFHGFPRDFYDAIPWDLETGWIMEDFHSPAAFLHYPENALKLLPKYGLPQTKSVKRLFTANSGLFFYLPECKKLWELLEDPNYFCTLLYSERIFFILANFHQFPGTLQFYQDFKECRDTRTLLKMLKNNFYTAHRRALAYAALSNTAREKIKDRIRKDGDCREFSYGHGEKLLFSYPLPTLPQNGREITIGRYRFKWLKNTAEATKAGIELDNCLGEWDGNRNSVAVVLRGREYLAAIEVEKDTVIQFLGKSNEPIEEDSELYAVIQKWIKNFSFKFFEEDFDDLPF